MIEVAVPSAPLITDDAALVAGTVSSVRTGIGALAVGAAAALVSFASASNLASSTFDLTARVHLFDPPTARIPSSLIGHVLHRGEPSSDFAGSAILAQEVADVSIGCLIGAIRRVFGDVELAVTASVDPEEGWTKQVIEVNLGIADLDVQFAKEDALYAFVDTRPELQKALRQAIITFS